MLGRREVIGFILAPLPTLAPFLLLFGLILLDRPADTSNIIGSMIQFSLLSYGACFLIGAPVHIWLRHTDQHSLSAYLMFTMMGVVIVGLVLGALEKVAPTPIEENPFGFTIWSRDGMITMFFFAITTLPSAFLFWRVAVKHTHLKMSAFDS